MRGDRAAGSHGPARRKGPLLRLTIQADACAIRRLLSRVVLALDGLRLSPDRLGDIELVLAEVLNNIQRHAYGGDPGEIELELASGGDVLICTVTDRGRPMPGGQLPAGRAVEVDVCSEMLPEGGFGWFLIRSHAARLDYRRLNDRNRLTVHLPLTGDTQDLPLVHTGHPQR